MKAGTRDVFGTAGALQLGMNWRPLLLLIPGLALYGADFCDPAALAGPYAFQLTGTTDIAGSPQPTASLGRLFFDGHGSLTGTASVAFRGLLLENPVTGSYEAKPDCTVVWKLRDDSGGFQNFSGTFSTDGTDVRFKQSDPGGVKQGTMKKTSDACSEADLLARYAFAVSGSTVPMQAGEEAHAVSAKGKLDVAANGSFQVDSDCSVVFQLTLAAPSGSADSTTMNMRGFLVSGGKEILAFQTDAGVTVAGRLTADATQSNSR